MKRIIVFALSMCSILTGCKEQQETVEDGSSSLNARATNVSYVCVGMETSKRFGSCPGCKYDSDRVNKLLKNKYGYKGVLLQSEKATKSAFVSAVKSAVASTPKDGLFILYYSGHGGSENLHSDRTVEPTGADEADEYLCLYDTYLLDDEVWTLISSCKGRVFLVFDCCHSQTMFRSVKYDISLEKGLAVPLGEDRVKSSGFNLKPRAVALGTDGFRMLCWSGCAEDEYSFGSNSGGVMTNSMLERWHEGISYKDLWSLMEKDIKLRQPSQHPKVTQYGSGYNESFR